jgi:hypothetical protein
MIAIADAMNTVEYVPLTIPISIVNANPSSASPPNRNSAEGVVVSSGRMTHDRDEMQDRIACVNQAFVIDFQCLSRSAINSARCRSSPPSRMLRSSGSARK